MGSTNSLCNKRGRKSQGEERLILPILNESIFPVLFSVRIKSFRGIALRNINVCLEVDLFQKESIRTNYVYSDINPLWNVNKKFEIVMNSIEDLHSHFSVNLLNEKKKVIGRIRIPFYTLAKGT